jgi:molecular chaperone DnaJ
MNPYEILGVEKNATPDQIKKAYRSLAFEYHPDRNKDESAEAKFKEITAAYETLTNPKPKAAPAAAGFSQGSNIDDFLFNMGFHSQRWSSAPNIATHVKPISVHLKFEEYCLGCEKDLTFEVTAACSSCVGVGATVGNYTECDKCAGRGTVNTQRGNFIMSSPCAGCSGSGRKITTPCATCFGRGVTTTAQTYRCAVPSLSGNRTLINTPIGMVEIGVRADPSPKMTLVNINVFSETEVSLKEALLGCKKSIDTVHGTKTVKIPPLKKGYTELRLKSLGAKSNNQIGDHVLKCIINLEGLDTTTITGVLDGNQEKDNRDDGKTIE